MKATFLFFVALIFCSSTLHAADKMTVAYATLGPGLSPGWITADKGIWRKHGLDVDLVYLGGGSRSVPRTSRRSKERRSSRSASQ